MFQIAGWNSNDEEQEQLAEKLFANVPSKPKKKRKHKENDDVDARPSKLSKCSDGEKKIDSEVAPDKKLKLLMEMLEGKRDDQGESKEISSSDASKVNKNIVNKQSDVIDSEQQSVFVVGSKDGKKRKKKKKKKQKKILEVKDSLEESQTQDVEKGKVHEDRSVSSATDINGKKRKIKNVLEVEGSLEQSIPKEIKKSKVGKKNSLSETKDEEISGEKRKKKKAKVQSQVEEKDNNSVKEELQVEITSAEKGLSKKRKKMQKEKEETSTCVRTEQNLERTDDNQSHTKQTDHKMIDSKISFSDSPSERTTSKGTDFKSKLQKKLSGAQFRWINEQLYTTESQNAFDMFSKDPNLFNIYHTGFQNQVESWPQNPVNVMIRYLNERPSDIIVADMGCGEAKIAQNVKQKVHSFDLVSHNEFVTACDMSKVPIDAASVDVTIFCLSLMGTNIIDFLKEANRILKHGGILKIAEVVSRFENIKKFTQDVCSLGFKFLSKDTSNKMFVLIDFEKISKAKLKSSNAVHLKPCVYKRR